MSLPVLLYALAPLLTPANPQDTLPGLWWGGLSLPDEFETVTLEIEEGEGGLRCLVGRPYDGIGAQVMEVRSTQPLVLEREGDGDTVVFTLEQVEEDLLAGDARLGARSIPLILRRLERLEPAELDPFLGDYVAETGERILVGRLPVATRHGVLACTWTLSGRERSLFPVARAEDGTLELVFGRDFQRPGPTEGTVRLAPDGSTFEWEAGDDGGFGERLPLSVDRSAVRAFLGAELERSGAPSLSVGVVHGDELVLAESVGVLNRESGEPATPDSLYQIASVTKVFTGALLVAMRDAGLVSLDDPVAGHLPADAGLPVGGEGITLRELVTHTSGLRLQPTNYVWNGRHNDDYTPELLLECLPETSLQFPRGTRWSYSNLGFVLLGHALARAGGASYEELLRRHVLDPLGMEDSTITLDAETRARLATHYWDDDPLTPTPPWIPGTIAAQGGLTSSVRDMARFLSANLRTDQVENGLLAAASLRELQRPVARRGGEGWIALGWFVDHEPASGKTLSHSGFTGGSSSYVALSPALDVGVVVLTNFGFDPAIRTGRWLLEETVRTAREHLIPSEYEARRWLEAGDLANAAWAYETLAEMFPERGDLARRAEEVRARVR